jgi:hypothetical protein
MRTSFFALILVIIGIIAAFVTIALAFQPVEVSQTTSIYRGNTSVTTYTKMANAGMGTIASAIVSAACFLTAGIRLGNHHYD